ncbi:MAG: hypothetical protein H0V21_05735 [Rubrobacter sp.]|nr:hypothetical protein [Rubrobacter sp.]
MEFSGERASLTDLADINAALLPVGARLWPIDLRGIPDDIRGFLAKPTLDEKGVAVVREHFLLPRERLLELIEQAGRAPQVPGGGEMSTLDATNDVRYPQLYTVEAGTDYTRFDRFHTNTSGDGPGVDEVMQILSGGGFRVLQQPPEEAAFTLHIDCVADEYGWLLTYDGGYPHIGSLSGGRPGTKLLVQAIGPAQWEMSYEE